MISQAQVASTTTRSQSTATTAATPSAPASQADATRASLRGLDFADQEAALTRGLDGGPPAPGQANTTDPAEAILVRAGSGQAPSGPGEWALLAKRVGESGAFAKRFPTGLTRCLRLAKVSWETVTEDQRAVFMALAGREALRTELLKNSALFSAITRLHIPEGGGTMKAANEAHHKQRIEDKRLRENGAAPRDDENWYSDDAVAYLMMSGEIARAALVEPARAGKSIVNTRLAQWVKTVGEEGVTKRLHELACGLTNLFALALARGAVKCGTAPTEADAAKWLFGWSLGHAAGLLDSDGKSCTYHPSRVMAALSTAKTTKVVGAGGVATPDGGTAAYDALAAFVQGKVKDAKLAAEHESRLALVQGSDKTHTFFLYKDLDRVWRPMDAYLNLEDLGGEQAGGFHYSDKISTLYFAVDKR